jgi:hypothetical protein
MEWLIPREASLWIQKHHQIEAPHHASLMNPPEHHAQFYAPTKYSTIEAFVRGFVAEIIGEGDILLQIVDWSPFTPAEEYLIGRLWNPREAGSCPSDGSACQFNSNETAAATALFSLTSCFGFKSYLYGARDQIVLFNWESEIWDTWTSSSSKAKEILQLIVQFKFEFVPEDSDE